MHHEPAVFLLPNLPFLLPLPTTSAGVHARGARLPPVDAAEIDTSDDKQSTRTNCQVEYGKITIACRSVSIVGDYVLTKLELLCGDDSRECEHYWCAHHSRVYFVCFLTPFAPRSAPAVDICFYQVQHVARPRCTIAKRGDVYPGGQMPLHTQSQSAAHSALRLDSRLAANAHVLPLHDM